MRKVYFLCHGNICRSVAAEMVFCDLLRKKGLEGLFLVDSFATSYEEIGNPIYPPMRRELASRGIPMHPHYAKRITAKEVEEADYLFYMDQENLYGLSRIYLNARNEGKIKPITFYTSSLSEVEDPWYTGRYGKVVDEIVASLNAFLDYLIDKGDL